MIYIMKVIQTSPGGQYKEEFIIEKYFKDVDSIVDDRLKLTDVDKNVINESYYTLCPYTIIIINDSVDPNISLQRYDKIKRVIQENKWIIRNDKINSILE